MADAILFNGCRQLLSVCLRVGQAAFSLLVVGAVLTAPGAALGLSLQRAMSEELNEHRAELEGSTQSQGLMQQLRRRTGGRAIPAPIAAASQVQAIIFLAHHDRAIDEQGADPAGASWSSPLRC